MQHSNVISVIKFSLQLGPAITRFASVFYIMGWQNDEDFHYIVYIHSIKKTKKSQCNLQSLTAIQPRQQQGVHHRGESPKHNQVSLVSLLIFRRQ
jgi:hypothetical protein